MFPKQVFFDKMFQSDSTLKILPSLQLMIKYRFLGKSVEHLTFIFREIHTKHTPRNGSDEENKKIGCLTISKPVIVS